MGLMTGKKGIIFGVSNKWSIAYGIAQKLFDEGADIAFSYSEVVESKVLPIAQSMNSKLTMACDAMKEDQVKAVFDAYAKTYDRLDFVIHSIAFAKREDLAGYFYDTDLDGWNTALGVSAYTLLPIVRYAKPLLSNPASVITLTYLGGERAVPNYNVMGVAKAALEASVRYLAQELGPDGVRVNAISAGPIKTLAAKGISGFDVLTKINSKRAPMKRNITLEEIGNAGLYLASDLSTGVTGETHHVDCGYHAIATARVDADLLKVSDEN